MRRRVTAEMRRPASDKMAATATEAGTAATAEMSSAAAATEMCTTPAAAEMRSAAATTAKMATTTAATGTSTAARLCRGCSQTQRKADRGRARCNFPHDSMSSSGPVPRPTPDRPDRSGRLVAVMLQCTGIAAVHFTSHRRQSRAAALEMTCVYSTTRARPHGLNLVHVAAASITFSLAIVAAKCGNDPAWNIADAGSPAGVRNALRDAAARLSGETWDARSRAPGWRPKNQARNFGADDATPQRAASTSGPLPCEQCRLNITCRADRIALPRQHGCRVDIHPCVGHGYG
jgi:hypothetical protein